jgi:Glycine-zipper domain
MKRMPPMLQRLAMLVAFGLTGCATVPTGPSVMTLPGTGKSIEQFRADEARCKDDALTRIGGQARVQSANERAAGTAVVGTAIGAVAGAALGGNQGAAVGAGVGLVAGSAIGADQSQASSFDAQRRYDQAFVQCMYAMGHRVPVRTLYTPRPAASYPPPPPPGFPPPPPPDYAPPPAAAPR